MGAVAMILGCGDNPQAESSMMHLMVDEDELELLTEWKEMGIIDSLDILAEPLRAPAALEVDRSQTVRQSDSEFSGSEDLGESTLRRIPTATSNWSKTSFKYASEIQSGSDPDTPFKLVVSPDSPEPAKGEVVDIDDYIIESNCPK